MNSRRPVNSDVGFLLMTVERNEIIAAFADVEQPDLRAIYPLGCCEDHEPDYQWYRRHSWQEFESELPTGRFDPFDFGSIHPVAFHYFSPGVLLATRDAMLSNAQRHVWLWDCWVHIFVPMVEDLDRFSREKFPFFSDPQRKVVANHLLSYLETKPYGDTDIERAITDVWWQSETQRLF